MLSPLPDSLVLAILSVVWKDIKNQTSSQDGCVGKYALPSCTTVAKNTTGLQNKYHPELSEN